MLYTVKVAQVPSPMGRFTPENETVSWGWVFRRLVDFGADPEILEEGWAHLGTDKIRQILPNLRRRIIDLNGRVQFGACVTDLLTEDGRCVGVRLRDGSGEYADVVVVATGHSARDAWRMMIDAGAKAEQGRFGLGHV